MWYEIIKDKNQTTKNAKLFVIVMISLWVIYISSITPLLWSNVLFDNLPFWESFCFISEDAIPLESNLNCYVHQVLVIIWYSKWTLNLCAVQVFLYSLDCVYSIFFTGQSIGVAIFNQVSIFTQITLINKIVHLNARTMHTFIKINSIWGLFISSLDPFLNQYHFQSGR